MTDMKHISQVPAGYLVRKTVNGSLHQRFFGSTAFGSDEAALMEAKTYRDQLLKKIPQTSSFQKHNINNNTGVVGVAWHCRPNSHRQGSVVHCFRGQMPKTDSEGAVSKAWSVQRLTLWGAYKKAVYWRKSHLEGKEPEESFVEDKFLSTFFPFFTMCARRESDDLVKAEMLEAMLNLKTEKETPVRIREAAAEALQRFGSDTRSFLNVVSSNSKVKRTPTLLEIARAAAQEQAV